MLTKRIIATFLVCLTGLALFRGVGALPPKSALDLSAVNPDTIETITVHGSIIGYSNEEDLNDYADLIVTGSVTTSLIQDIPVTSEDSSDFCTLTPFTIDMVLKGSYHMDTVTVVQPVAIADRGDGVFVKLILGDYEELKIGNTYVLYLKKSRHEELGENAYSVVSCHYGQYNMSDQDPHLILATDYLLSTGEDDTSSDRDQQWERVRRQVLARYGELVMGAEAYEAYQTSVVEAYQAISHEFNQPIDEVELEPIGYYDPDTVRIHERWEPEPIKEYVNEAELSEDADLIVAGRVTTTLAQDTLYIRPIATERGSLIDFYTVTPVTIDAVLKGNWDQDTVTVLQPAALTQSEGYPPEKLSSVGYKELMPGSTYILYLAKVTGSLDGPAGEDAYCLLSTYFGHYNLIEDFPTYSSRSPYWREVKLDVRDKYSYLAN